MISILLKLIVYPVGVIGGAIAGAYAGFYGPVYVCAIIDWLRNAKASNRFGIVAFQFQAVPLGISCGIYLGFVGATAFINAVLRDLERMGIETGAKLDAEERGVSKHDRRSGEQKTGEA